MVKPMVVDFCSVGELMLPWVKGVEFKNTCTVLGK